MTVLFKCVNSSAALTTKDITISQDLTSTTEATPTVNTPLAQFDQAANEIQVAPALITEIPRPVVPGYPPAEITNILSRAYKLTSINWTSASTVDVRYFPEALFTAGTFIANVMTNFKYFRAKGVKIVLRLSSTPFHQGALMVGWIPDVTTTLTLPDIQQLSCCQAIILSASTQDTATITIPWLSAVEYLKLTEANPREIGALIVRPLVALVAPVSASSSIEVTMYAQFIEPQVQGYVYLTPGSSPPLHHQASQRNRFAPEQSIKDEKGIDAKGIVSTVSKVVRQAPIIGGIWSTIADVVNSVAGDLSRPTSNQAFTKTIESQCENLSYCSGEYFGEPLSLYPNAQMEQKLTMYGMETSHMTLATIAQKPMLFDVFPLNATTTTYTTVVDALISGSSVGNPDYVKYIAWAHARWRGSMKYSLFFCCNAFYTTRVRLSINYGTRTGSIASTEDIPHKIIEIKGDTWHDVTIPYMRQFIWTPTGLTSDAPTLTIKLECPIVGENLPTTPTIYLSIFRSAAEDIQFSKLQNAAPVTPTVHERLHKQVSLFNRFEKPFDPILEGSTYGTEIKYIVPETTGTASDCMKRWSLPKTLSVAGINRYSYPAGQTIITGDCYEPYHYFARLFKYWRGSRRIMHIGRGLNYNLINYPTNQAAATAVLQPGNGMYVIDTNANASPNVEVPWYANMPYMNITTLSCAYSANPEDIYFTVGGSISDANFIVAGGDDFTCFHLLWPIILPASATTTQPPSARTARSPTNQSLHFSDSGKVLSTSSSLADNADD